MRFEAVADSLLRFHCSARYREEGMDNDWPPLAYILKPFDKWLRCVRHAEAGLRGVPTMLRWARSRGIRFGP